MPSYERIRYETTAQAVWVTLDGPNELNLVDEQFLDELRDAFVRAGLDEERSVVVLRGSGRVFSGGGDLGSDVARMAREGMTPDDVARMHQHVHVEYPVFDAIERCPKTTIAAINGDAFGAAVDVIMMCDLALAVDDAHLAFAPGKWGLCDSPNASRLPQRIGLARAKDLLFTARSVAATEALELGLVNRICERSRFDDAVLEFVGEVLTTSPDARRLLKRVMQRSLPAHSPAEHFETAVGEDFREGVRAFTEKRPPAWTAEALVRRTLEPSPSGASEASQASPNGHGRRNGEARPFQPATWKLRELRQSGAPPDAVDPGTDGDIWKLWNVAYTDDIHVLYATVTAGERTGAHTHPDANHYTLIIEGTALVWMEGTMVRLSPGDVVNIPTGVLHDFGAASDEDVWAVDMTSPPFDPEKMQFDPSREEEIARAFDEATAKA